MEPLFTLRSAIDNTPANNDFTLHTHETHVLYLCLTEEAQCVMEGETHSLHYGDIIIIRKHLHHMYRTRCADQQSLILQISPAFFVQNDCTEYESHFLKLVSSGRKIDAKLVHSSGLYDAMMRLRKYSDNCTNIDKPVIRGLVLEVLYLLHGIHSHPDTKQGNERLQTVLSYINENFTSPITLDTICENCFISKYHLCHIFPQIIGVTVHQYITGKRLAYVQRLLREGLTLTQASHNAGFSTYSSFYRAYLAEHGHSPLLDK